MAQTAVVELHGSRKRDALVTGRRKWFRYGFKRAIAMIFHGMFMGSECDIIILYIHIFVVFNMILTINNRVNGIFMGFTLWLFVT
jgi:hypothetical protein